MAAVYGSLHEPPPGCTRWTPGRKGWIADQVARGEISRDEAAAQWGIDPGELATWAARYRSHGLAGLCVRKLQEVGR